MQRIMLAAAVLVVGCWSPASAENEERICWNEWGSTIFFQKWSNLTSKCLLGGADHNKAAKSRKWMPPIFIASKHADDVQVIHDLVKAGAGPLIREPNYASTPLRHHVLGGTEHRYHKSSSGLRSGPRSGRARFQYDESSPCFPG